MSNEFALLVAMSLLFDCLIQFFFGVNYNLVDSK